MQIRSFYVDVPICSLHYALYTYCIADATPNLYGVKSLNGNFNGGLIKTPLN